MERSKASQLFALQALQRVLPAILKGVFYWLLVEVDALKAEE